MVDNICCRGGSYNDSNILRGLRRRHRFHAHGEECAEQQDRGAPKLCGSQMFAEDPSGQSHCAEWAKQLERLGKGDTDFLNGNVIKNVRHGDAGHGRDHENEIHEPAYLHRGRDIPESTG